MATSIQFSVIDGCAIVGYFLLVTYFGVSSSRNESSAGFLIGDRALNSWSAACTIAASKIGAGLLLTFTALAYQYGGGAIWLFVGYIFGYVVFYFFARPLKQRADEKNYLTLPDYFFDRYGPFTGQLVSFFVILNMLGWVVVTFIGGAKVVSTYVPISFEVSTFLVAGIILLYLLAGGFLAVVRTDIAQLLGISLLFILMIYLLCTSTNTWMSEFSLFSMPFSKAVSFFLVGILMPLASAEMWQRVYAVKDQKTLKYSLILASSMYVILGVTLLGITLSIRSVLTNLEPDTALVQGLHSLLPAGLSGLAVIVFYSAIMSTADTLLFTSSASISNDFLGRNKAGSEDQTVRLMKPTMLVCTLACIGFSILFRDVVDTTFYFAALSMSLGFVILVDWLLPRLSATALNCGLLCNLIGISVIGATKGIGIFLATYSLGLSSAGLLLGAIFSTVRSKKTNP